MSHTARLPFFSLAPNSLKAMINLSKSASQSSFGERIFELVNLRVSQINGCGVCVDMHWRFLLKQGAEPRHLNAIAGWREAPFFSARERAALASCLLGHAPTQGWPKGLRHTIVSGLVDVRKPVRGYSTQNHRKPRISMVREVWASPDRAIDGIYAEEKSDKRLQS